MTEELEQLLKNLKLRRMLEIYDEQLRAADKDDISYSEFVTLGGDELGEVVADRGQVRRAPPSRRRPGDHRPAGRNSAIRGECNYGSGCGTERTQPPYLVSILRSLRC